MVELHMIFQINLADGKLTDKALIKEKDGTKSKTGLYYVLQEGLLVELRNQKVGTLELLSHRRTELSEDTECEIVNRFTMDNKSVNLSSQTV